MIEKINQVSKTTNVRQMQLEHGAAVGNVGNFSQMLQLRLGQTDGVKFSKHAAQRVEQRGIEMSESLLNGINQAVDKAKEKGAKDVVVISSQGAFIVNVPNKMVITSMSEPEMRENIFTNIDSAVLI